MYLGWTQVASTAELTADVVPVDFGGRRFIAVGNHNSGYRIHDGTCPHRGAHLGFGGRLDGTAVICPFHGHRVHLGAEEPALFCVTGYPTEQWPGGLFMLPDESCRTALPERLAGLAQSHHVHPAFHRVLPVPPEYVIENALDADHFATVHALDRRPRLEVTEEAGVLRVEGSFDMVRPNKWQVEDATGEPARTRFSAEIFSPTVVVSELGPAAAPNVVVTAATPTAAGGCVARVTVALPRHRAAGPPTVRELSSLVSGSRTAFEQDAVVWEHLDTTVTPRYTEADGHVRLYRDYCRRFLAHG